MKDFKNLKVWQKGIKLVVEIYKTSKKFKMKKVQVTGRKPKNLWLVGYNLQLIL